MNYIDESLARGLASRFLSECEDGIDKFFDKLASTNCRNSTKKRWIKKNERVSEYLEKVSFSTHWIGSNSKPAMGFIGIGPEKQRYSTWEEKCLTGWCLIDQYEVGTTGPDPTPFVISHHALSRIFQRATVLQNIVEDWRFEQILNLLRPLPFWAAFWSSCLYGAQGERTKKLDEKVWNFRFRPVIPSEHGLFLCECSTADPRIALRTFVNNSQLRHEQRHLKKILDAVATEFASQPIALHPWSFVYRVSRTDTSTMFMRERLFAERSLLRGFLCEDITKEEKDGIDEMGFFD